MSKSPVQIPIEVWSHPDRVTRLQLEIAGLLALRLSMDEILHELPTIGDKHNLERICTRLYHNAGITERPKARVFAAKVESVLERRAENPPIVQTIAKHGGIIPTRQAS